MLFELLAWYARHGRPLPWREPGTSAWAVLVCEVMSQQTPVGRVLPAWQQWMQRWPTPADLAEASTADVILAWGKLGYPRRALRLQECAVAITRDHAGQLPHDRDDLLALPGIGPYTADALIAFAYHRRSTVLDTNTRRVLARLGGQEAPPAHLRRDEVSRAEALVPTDDELAWQWNAALMELGALVCTSRSPRCEDCPLTGHCSWLAAGKPAGAVARRTQGYAGTHREARGKVMRVLRSSRHPLSRSALRERSGLPEARFGPALDSLVADGLSRSDDAGYTLP
ncbi:MAG: A/G-specific adenine glycosylase [Actinomycetaceae bacterium]|nr:A/G-specific adenine glycosylase [Actinomycetaceae bacterium]